MFVHHRTQGFVLGKVDQGEADQLFSIYTKDFGKLKILGRSIRKITSKLRAGIPVFCICEIEFIQGKAYKTLTDAILIKDFENIKKDLIKLKIAHQSVQVFDRLIKPPQKDDKIYELLNEIFFSLNNHSSPATHCLLLYYYFLWNLISILGYEPELYKCLDCSKKLEPKNLYFTQKGGVICSFCSNKNDNKNNKNKSEILKIDVGVVKILREVLKKDLHRFLKIQIKGDYQKSLNQIADFYVATLPN